MSVRVAVAMVAGYLVSAAAVSAQGLEGPVNLPPAGFEGQQFVDNAGCAFARAGVSGNTVWVPRVNQNRDQICGLAPSFGAAAVVDAPSAPPRSPILTPGPSTDPGAPIPTVASTVPATAPPRAAAPVAAAPAPTPVPAAPRGLTLAEACEGRTGVQPGLRDARTGEPIDCGGAVPVAAPAPAPAPEPLRLTLADACARQVATGVRLINSATGQPIACPTTVAAVAAPAPATPAVVAPRTMTRAEACSEQAARGVTLQDAATGAPIVCPPAAITSPTYTTTVAQTVAAQTVARRIDPLSAATLSGTYATGPVTPVRVGDVLSAETISGVVTQIYTGPPAGYEPVWTDGRLNPNRGLPEIQAQVPVAASPSAGDRVSTMSAPQPQEVAGAGFVQVGTYGDPANAARAEATLRALGLPVSMSSFTRNGVALQVVAAGPVAAVDLAAALDAARVAGYADAFIR